MVQPIAGGCCRCCDNAHRARTTLASVLARGDDPSDWWCAHPENICHCPSQPAIERCRCLHCLSWLRRAPRCARKDCTEYAGWGPLCRPHEQAQRERRNVTSRKAAKLRRPPDHPYVDTPKTCNLCGTSPLPPRRRSWCSDECVLLAWISRDAAAAAHHLVQLHGEVCWACDGPGPLEVEHIRPLWSLTDDERLQLRWWLPYNLQLLCVACHRAKSAHEAGLRAALARDETPPLPWSPTPPR